MRTALITTTINTPTVLSLYRKLDPDVRFFVAMDKKTPSAAREFCLSLGNCAIAGEQKYGEKYACDDLIGHNTIARRNIALLDALKWGAELIVSCDDDNIPINRDYFTWYDALLCDTPLSPAGSWNGVAVDKTDWFDVGALLDPVAPHRGFPHDRKQTPSFSHVVDVKVGVAAGICLGDPDISAYTRLAAGPICHRVSELLRAGIVVDPQRTKTVFNSQNTAFIRELAPCFLMVPSYGRFDDIYASLVAQRVMREFGYHVHFGRPLVWQQRNPHNLLKDLAQEQWGATHILEFSAWLDAFLGVHDIVGFLKVMATNLPKFIPAGTQELWLAWLADCEAVMG